MTAMLDRVRRLTLLSIVMATLALTLVPASSAIVYNCPPHPSHCSLPLLDTNGTTVQATATVKATTSADAAVIESISATVQITVFLQITSNVTSVTNVTVQLNTTEAFVVDPPTANMVTLSGHDKQQTVFTGHLDPDLGEGYVAFVPITISSGADSVSGFVPVEFRPHTTTLLPWFTGIGGLLAGGGAGFAWARTKKPDE